MGSAQMSRPIRGRDIQRDMVMNQCSEFNSSMKNE